MKRMYCVIYDHDKSEFLGALYSKGQARLFPNWNEADSFRSGFPDSISANWEIMECELFLHEIPQEAKRIVKSKGEK